VRELKSEILRLLKEDEEFRYAVAGLIGLEEVLRRLDRHEAELVRLREDMNRGFERHDRELARLREDMNKLREDLNRLREDMNRGFQRYDEELARLREDLNKLRDDMNRGFQLLRRHIDALGARWGILAEEAFREGLRGILSEELGLEVERWVSYDEKGLVYGRPSTVEVDVAIKDGRIVLVEVSSHVRASDVAAFVRKAELYARKTGRRPDRLVMVTPFAEEAALGLARELGVEIYTRV